VFVSGDELNRVCHMWPYVYEDSCDLRHITVAERNAIFYVYIMHIGTLFFLLLLVGVGLFVLPIVSAPDDR
jgi:hypothetical protein